MMTDLSYDSHLYCYCYCPYLHYQLYHRTFHYFFSQFHGFHGISVKIVNRMTDLYGTKTVYRFSKAFLCLNRFHCFQEQDMR